MVIVTSYSCSLLNELLKFISENSECFHTAILGLAFDLKLMCMFDNHALNVTVCCLDY